jgi:hypothetical protein
MMRDDAAKTPIKLHKLRREVSILEGSGRNIAMLTGADGKVFIDAGSRLRAHESLKRLTTSAAIRSGT